MNTIAIWADLFKYSSFFCLKKDEVLPTPLENLVSRLDYPNIENFHPKRKQEFLLGRVCASKAHEMHFGSELLSLPISTHRSPEWPPKVLGSITHNQNWVGAAISKEQSLLGLGIDFEVMGRAKLELSRHIRTEEDLKSHKALNDNELLTLIFSAKESLYKALYPTAKCFFGFDAAAVKKIDFDNGTFQIDLITQISPFISPNLGPLGNHHFKGAFRIFEKNCLTVLEIPN